MRISQAQTARAIGSPRIPISIEVFDTEIVLKKYTVEYTPIGLPRSRRRGHRPSLRRICLAKPTRHDPCHAEDAPCHGLIDVACSDRIYIPPAAVRPEQSVAAEGRDRKFAAITVQLPQSLSQDSDITCADAEQTGLNAAHLDIVEPSRDLREARVYDQLAGWAERAIGLACQVGDVRQ